MAAFLLTPMPLSGANVPDAEVPVTLVPVSMARPLAMSALHSVVLLNVVTPPVPMHKHSRLVYQDLT